eukprot:GILJ01003462.1.p1 GENE.GILJ01003462.1~~GILJ01003462.1.p1  ORF type:complete len:1476 (+),score=301.52 GILJ01003462.1:977-5404(+)
MASSGVRTAQEAVHHGGKQPRKSQAPTVQDIISDQFTALANAHWAPSVTNNSFSNQLVEQIYNSVKESDFDISRIMLLEFSGYLENYLWKHFDAKAASVTHILSIIIMVNDKFRENNPAWVGMRTRGELFPAFFERVLLLKDEPSLTTKERAFFIVFLIHCFQSLEEQMVRTTCLRLVGMSLWRHISEGRRNQLLAPYPKLRKAYKKLEGQKQSSSALLGSNFLPELVDDFIDRLAGVTKDSHTTPDMLLYFERFIEFMIDLMNQLPTRRFFHGVIEEKQLVVHCRLSTLAQKDEGKLFLQLVDILKFYDGFEINDQTGEALETADMLTAHYNKLLVLQRIAYNHFKSELAPLALANVASIDSREALFKHLQALSTETLKQLAVKLRLFPDSITEKPSSKQERRLVLEAIIAHHEKRTSQIDAINDLPLYPTETLLWDENMVPSEHYTGEYCLALPKLNLQFLTFHDYLLRNFNLFRLESTYEIRDDLEDAIHRMAPVACEGDRPANRTTFSGWARMALPIRSFTVVNVKRADIGENKPAEVRAEMVFSLAGLRPAFKKEWDELRQHDVVFLVSIQASNTTPTGDRRSLTIKEFPVAFGVSAVRGGEVHELIDEQGNVINEVNPAERKPPVGDVRTLRIFLDPAQYQIDMSSLSEGGEDVHETFNLLVRRKAKENNFKAILETIRDLMNTHTVVPDWLHDIFLGYGDPGSAQYFRMPNQITSIDFKDTFLDLEHLRSSFPERKVEFVRPDGTRTEDPSVTDIHPPFRVSFRGATVGADGVRDISSEVVEVQGSVAVNPGPYPFNKPKLNTVKFTSVQTEAIRAGVNPGLTMVVGPPGTGKTDVAVQIISLLYHNFPEQRILLVTHSNQALNDLFQKIMQLDISERYLLRLGAGEQQLETEKDFSKWGRVNFMLQRRLELLAEVERLALSLNLSADVGYTCETASYFFMYHIVARWEEFQARLKDPACVLPDHETEDEPIVDTEATDRLALIRREEKRKREMEVEAQKAKRRRTKKGKKAQEEEEEDEEMPDVPADNMQQDPAVEEPLPVIYKPPSRVYRRKLVETFFPFKGYFANAPQPLFKAESFDDDLAVAEGCWRHLQIMFQELEECHAFELLRNSSDRGNYLVTKQAKIIAMTCTHAALKRRDFVKLGLKYDNLLMEEAAQVLEVETFIPMLLQNPQDNKSRLKRVILIGDHNQLPPVVQNMAFQKYGHLDQSLFARFVRLQTPTVQLNRQGRARPSIAQLYNWRYEDLGDLPNVLEAPEYHAANPGLAFDYQFVDVAHLNGQGEMTPSPHFYQNLAEAEYVVAVYMYMRLLGYPASKIAILTTYNGQKHLIRDVIQQRCAWNPLFGMPSKVTTVDRYQGQQNDYVLLSLVRTRHVGHIRDVRRLVVAMSRARLGLYVFGRKQLFENCYELTPTLDHMFKRSVQLALIPGESFPATRKISDPTPEAVFVSDLHHMWQVMQQLMQSLMAQSR